MARCLRALRIKKLAPRRERSAATKMQLSKTYIFNLANYLIQNTIFRVL